MADQHNFVLNSRGFMRDIWCDLNIFLELESNKNVEISNKFWGNNVRANDKIERGNIIKLDQSQFPEV